MVDIEKYQKHAIGAKRGKTCNRKDATGAKRGKTFN